MKKYHFGFGDFQIWSDVIAFLERAFWIKSKHYISKNLTVLIENLKSSKLSKKNVFERKNFSRLLISVNVSYERNMKEIDKFTSCINRS